jgi:hypothetical protein
MAIDGALFNKALPAEAANVAFHLCAAALVAKTGEIIFGHYPKPTQVCECTNLRFAQRIFPVSTAIDRNRAVETTTRPSGIRSLFPAGLALLSVCTRTLTGPL